MLFKYGGGGECSLVLLVLLVLERVAPMQKSSARMVLMGMGSSRASEGGFRGGSLGRALGDCGWAVRRKESRLFKNGNLSMHSRF